MVIAVTGVPPATGAVTPAMAKLAPPIVTVVVAGNTAVTTPEPDEFVAVAPATVKKFAATPVKV